MLAAIGTALAMWDASCRRAALDKLITEELARRRALSGDQRHDDVLSRLLAARDEEGNGLSDGQLSDELTGLELAGHETTATALAWTLHLLAHHRATRDALVARRVAGTA